MLLREFDLAASRKQFPLDVVMKFESQARCVAALLERCWEKTDMGTGTWKLYIEMVERVDRARILGSDVIQTQLQGDVKGFIEMEPHLKKERALDWLMEGIGRIAQAYNWDMAPFDRAAACVKKLDYENEWVWRKPKSNRSRSLKAEVVVSHGTEAAELTLLIRNRSGDIVKRKLIYSDRPCEFSFKPQLGELRWIDNSTVTLFPKHYREEQEVKEGYPWKPLSVIVEDREVTAARN